MTDLMSKLPLREHFRNMAVIFGKIREMDRSYFWCSAFVHAIRASIPYIELLLTAYLLDSISGGVDFREMFSKASAAVALIFALHFAASTIGNRLEVRKDRMYHLFESSTQMKMLNMDFSLIDSPTFRELQERIEKDHSWGAGFLSVLWGSSSMLENLMQLVGAGLVGIPAWIYLIRSGGVRSFGILVLTGIFMAAGIYLESYFVKMEQKFQFSMSSYPEGGMEEREAKEKLFNYTYPMAYGGVFPYQNGKDIRLYQGYSLMKRWTMEGLHYKEHRRRLREGAVGAAGRGCAGGAMHGMIEGGSYLLMVGAALMGALPVGSVIRFAGCMQRLMDAVHSLAADSASFALSCRRNLSTLEFLELSDEMYKGKLPVEKRSDCEYQIEFRDVSFRYPGTEQWALRHFSLKLRIGEKLAIVGRNGSGKTTLIKLLCRLYDPDEGVILLNGVDIRKFKQEEYARLFSVVFQDYTLFPFLMSENVAVSCEYDAEKVISCLKNAGFGERLTELPDGIETYLYKDYENSGLEISGGEAQKIAIARAIYRDAPFILLDEPTATFDPKAEYEIYTGFDKIIGKKTAIYISHRLSSCRFCEKIAVLQKGELVQLGDHDTLVQKQDGEYYAMWHAQAQYYQED